MWRKQVRAHGDGEMRTAHLCKGQQSSHSCFLGSLPQHQISHYQRCLTVVVLDVEVRAANTEDCPNRALVSFEDLLVFGCGFGFGFLVFGIWYLVFGIWFLVRAWVRVRARVRVRV